MKSRSPRSKLRAPLILSVLLMGLPGVTPALADDEGLYIETLNISSGLVGETPREELSKTYVAYDKMKVVSSDPQGAEMILDPVKGTLTFLNPEAKEYYQIDAKGMAQSMSQPGLEQMQAMMEQNKVAVEPTEETQKINGWSCKKYRVHKTGMMEVEQEIWATEDVSVDVDRYTDLMSMSGPEGLLGDSPAAKTQRDEMAKIKGYPILTTSKMQMMGSTMETKSEVKAIRKEPMPAALFEIPEGYAKKEMRSPPSEGGHP
jgi:hypothetical protein